jgi:ABC-type glycerol-3-phosphate transport system substrate-binding protein
MKKTIFALALVTVLASCGGASTEVATDSTAAAVDTAVVVDTTAITATDSTTAKIPVEEVK